MGLLDKNGDLVIDGQRIRSYNNLKVWKTRPKAKDGFLRFDKRMRYWYLDADDGSQEHLVCGDDIIPLDYGFEKIEEIWEAYRRKELEKGGYLKCYVCNIVKPGPVYLYLQKTYRLFWDNGVRY
jgi:hypothetical protein